MNLRKRVMGVLARTQEGATVVALLMQSMTLTLVAFEYIRWRGFNTYLGILILFSLIVTGIMVWGYIYVEVFGLFKAKKSTVVKMDPVHIYALTPYQEMMLRTANLPQLRHFLAQAQAQGLPTEDLQESITRIERWVEKGFIPRADYPDHLRELYYPREGHRI